MLPSKVIGSPARLGQFLLIDRVNRIPSGGKRDVHIGFRFFDMTSVSGVQQLQVGCSGGVGTDMVENANKDGISLPVYFLKARWIPDRSG